MDRDTPIIVYSLGLTYIMITKTSLYLYFKCMGIVVSQLIMVFGTKLVQL